MFGAFMHTTTAVYILTSCFSEGADIIKAVHGLG